MPRSRFAMAALLTIAAACDSSRSLAPSPIKKFINGSVPYVASVTVTDLGAYGGQQGGYSYASDVNDSGTVVGYTMVPGLTIGKIHLAATAIPFLWTPQAGQTWPIPVCCRSNAYATGINDSGVVVGSTYPTSGNATGWMYRNGQIVALAPLYPAEGSANTVETAKISRDGRINGTGWGSDVNNDQNGIIWNDGNPSVAIGALVLPPYPSVIPYPSGSGVDDNGDVIGNEVTYQSAGWLTDVSGNTTWFVPTIGGQYPGQSYFYDVNTSHEVVGMAEPLSGGRQAFLLDIGSGQTTLLGALSGAGDFSTANGINESSFVVGQSEYAVPNTSTYSNAAFLWASRMGMVNLGSLGGSTPSCSANAINKDMQGDTIYVAGWCSTAVGTVHAVRWTVTIGYRLLLL